MPTTKLSTKEAPSPPGPVELPADPAPVKEPAAQAEAVSEPAARKAPAQRTTARKAAAKRSRKPATAKTGAEKAATGKPTPAKAAAEEPATGKTSATAPEAATETTPDATSETAPETGPGPEPKAEPKTEVAPDSSGPSASALLTMAAAITGGFLALLDTTIVNVSIEDTTARFGGINQVQWVVTAYLIALAAVMPATGWLATRFGAKRVFATATALFALGSAGCAASQTLPELIAARGLSGAAAGVLTPVSTILLTRGVPREHLGRVQALNGSVMLISPLLGPTIGGLLVAAGGWSAVYLINIPLCIALFAVTLRWVRKDAPDGPGARPLDVVGLLSSATCTVCTVLAIHEFADKGVTASPVLLAPLALAVVSGTVFVVRQLRARFPLLDLRLFRNRVYATAVINVFCLGFVLYSPMMLIPLYFESARGESSVTTGLLMSTGGLGVVTAAWLSRVLLRKLGGGATVVIGITLTMLATAPLTTLTSDTSYLLICASLVVRGLGTGLTIVPTMTRAFQSIRQESIPDASSQLNLTQRIGGALAIAVVTVVLTQAAEERHGLVPAAFAHSFGWLLGVYALTLVPALALLAADRREARLSGANA
ncbi:DHA2 family efflux MFS transporter permease subunit [Streptomyces sp. CB01881]|uniref:DHA2 family efflux MFS transporter permease subunit n=1 Tax=Streptomyces sp. CB01881 TaxID=2078691 RepID=UPI000CDBCBFF|nr:DHA2 family efflux MFS transporter permease subunit [Streptomyces sp. CB01881]AUY50634.1 MFS transporter [Streptomyces sp. CB01881]TYC74020.1 DHA2 family efflux MFS transporter permease subunit [Streptomyces sp. CB01881]